MYLCNLKSIDFLDVTFNLAENNYKPYRKPNNKPLYLNVHSNHPPSVIKQLPMSIEKRISDTSSDKKVFDQSIHIYKEALKESGFKNNLTYVEAMKIHLIKKEKEKDNMVQSSTFIEYKDKHRKNIVC